jgi:CCR4-NOT transcription complex subunit 6
VTLENCYNYEQILLTNVHIHWNPVYKDVKLVQTIMMMEHIETLLKSHEFIRKSPSVIICGDFNSTLDSGVYEFMSQGIVGLDHSCFNNLPYTTCFSSTPQHNLDLKDTHRKPFALPFTNFTATFTDIIDYIWYTEYQLKLTGVLGSVDKEYVKEEIGFPNEFYPSDHIPLMASFSYVSQK